MELPTRLAVFLQAKAPREGLVPHFRPVQLRQWQSNSMFVALRVPPCNRVGLPQLPHSPGAASVAKHTAGVRRKGRACRRACRQWASAVTACYSAAAEDRRRFLLNYVQQCDVSMIDTFLEHAPTQVGHACTAGPYPCLATRRTCAYSRMRCDRLWTPCGPQLAACWAHCLRNSLTWK